MVVSTEETPPSVSHFKQEKGWWWSMGGKPSISRFERGRGQWWCEQKEHPPSCVSSKRRGGGGRWERETPPACVSSEGGVEGVC